MRVLLVNRRFQYGLTTIAEGLTGSASGADQLLDASTAGALGGLGSAAAITGRAAIALGQTYGWPYAAAALASGSAVALSTPAQIATDPEVAQEEVQAGAVCPLIGRKGGSVGDGALSRSERLNTFYDRLGTLPRADSPGEALSQVRDTLNGVEDEFSGVPYYPVPGIGQNNGRMYPPFNDQVLINGDGSLLARTRGHDILLGEDGGLTIIERSSPDYS